MIQQRRVPRVPIFRRILIDDLEKSRDGLVAMATVYQIGALGCAARTMELYFPGAKVRVTFFDDNDDNPLSFVGTIVWGLADEDTPFYRYGVEFEKIEAGKGNVTHSLLEMTLRSTGHSLEKHLK